MAQNLKTLDDSNFQSEIASGVTLVDFYADWCGPCRMIAPIVEELSNEMNGKAKVAKLDIEAAQQTTSSLGITSIPTLIVFKDGKEFKRVLGVRDKRALTDLIQSAF